MAITFEVAPLRAKPVSPNFEQLSAPPDLLLHLHSQIRPNRSRNRAHQPNPVDFIKSSFIDAKHDGWLFQEGFEDEFQMADVRTQNNGFVKTVVEAYNGCHHHLVIKPDDIWIAILTQLSVHVNANSKELRSFFVKHQGKKTLRVYMPGNQRIVDFGNLSVQMTDEIEKNILDPALQEWVFPSFTTTTATDTTICSVLLMSTMKAYFVYDMSLCGIPSITFEGIKSDWEALLQKSRQTAILPAQLMPLQELRPRA